MPFQETAICAHHARRFVSACLGVLCAVATAVWGQVPAPPSASRLEAPVLPPHMPEEARAAIDKVVVISGRGPANQEVSGTYERATPGLVGGMDEGSRMGTISKEIGGVPVNIPIPGLALPGAILGGLSGATRRQIQEFRDALTEEIINADSPPLRSDGLAIDTFWGIRRLPHLESHLFSQNVEIADDTDAVLYVTFDDLSINVEGSQAIITTSAIATLRRHADNAELYQTVVHYEDRDSLRSWTANDNALWRDYTNFARYFLGREVAADIFDRVALERELKPTPTATAEAVRKEPNTFRSETTMPTLAWQLTHTAGTEAQPWADAQVRYDIEIFDNQQLVYDAQSLPEPSHTLTYELEACNTYRWSVRPSYHANGQVRFGEWMRLSPQVDDKKKKKKKNADEQEAPPGLTKKGIFGRDASEAPAYIQDFATLKVDCD